MEAPPFDPSVPGGQTPGVDIIRVLLIEDDSGYALALGRTLTRAVNPSFQLQWVDRLDVGLDRLRAGGVDAVVMDLLLPDGAGLSSLARLREWAPGLPVVVLTAVDDEALGVEAVQRGAQDYLFKSEVHGHHLGRALRYAIERARAERLLSIQVKVTRCLAEAATFEGSAPAILRTIGEGLGWTVGALWVMDRRAGVLRCQASWHKASAGAVEFAAASQEVTFVPGVGLPGRTWAIGLPIEIGNVVDDPRYLRAPEAARSGLRWAIGFPIVADETVVGVLEFLGREVGPPNDALLRAMAALGSQIGQFIVRQRALRDSEVRKAAIFEIAPDAIVTMDAEGKIVEFNPAAERTFGYPRAEAVGRPMAELIVPPSLRGVHRWGLTRFLETGESVMLDRWLETRAMRRGGEEFAADLAVTRIPTGEAPLFTGFIRDITEREQSLLELLRGAFLGALAAKVGLALIQDEPLPAILDRCAEVLVRFLEVPLVRIWTLDDEGKVLECRACRGMDASVPESVRVVSPRRVRIDPSVLTCRHSRAGAIGDAAEEWARGAGIGAITVHPMVVGDRLEGILELFAHKPLERAALEALEPVMDGIAQCVERERSETRLRTSETRLRFLIERMPGVLWTTDLDLRFTMSAGTNLGGLNLAAGRGQTSMTLAEFFQTDDPDFPAIVAHRRALRGERVSYEVEWVGRLFQSHVEPLYDKGSRLLGCIGVALDVTELRSAERTLRRTREEFRTAGEIQNVFYPKTAPRTTGYDIFGASIPAQAAGGDYFDFLTLPDGRLGIAIGDVSGHGLGPALLMASTRAYLRALATMHTNVEEILARLNQVLAHDVGDERFVTLTLVQLDPATHTLSYYNAGHPTGFVLDRMGAVKAMLIGTGLPLGLFPDGNFPAGPAVVLERGDLVLLLTDGFAEAIDAEGQRLGVEALLEVVRIHRDEPAQVIVEFLHAAVGDFTGQKDQADDITTIVVKFDGEARPEDAGG